MKSGLSIACAALVGVGMASTGGLSLASPNHSSDHSDLGIVGDGGALYAQFDSVAQEWGVPTALLISVSNAAGQWFPIEGPDSVHARKEAGHMGLRDWGEGGPSAELGSELLGVPVEEILNNPHQNLRAGAAILAYYAEASQGEVPEAELTLDSAEAWWDATAAYAGANLEVHGDLFAARVFHGVETGLEAVNPRTGEWLHSDSLQLPVNVVEWMGQAQQAWAECKAETARAGTSDYAGAEWYGACNGNYANYSRTASNISFVIIHVAEGSYQGTLSWFQNCSAGVSAHYTVSKYGDIGQSVKEEDVAYHAGYWDYNLASVGIEHEGYTYTASTFTDAMYRASAALTKDICNRNGVPKNRTYVIGHFEVPGCSSSGGGGAGCHTDPGPYFDWTYYMGLVNGGGTSPTPTPPPSTSEGNILGIVAEGDVFSGPRISGASVSISGGGSTSSSSTGYFEFRGKSTGTYTLTASASGYDTASRTCAVSAGIDNWCSIALSVAGTSTPTPEPDPDPLPGGCDERSMPQTLTATASTTGASPFSATALALLLGFGIRPIIRRRRR